jgi:excisionase family DNA binding protein
MSQPLTVSINEFAQAVGVHVRTVERLVRARRIRVIRIASCVRIPRAELDRAFREGITNASQLNHVSITEKS